MIKLYHGTDIYSALDILNNGLDRDKVFERQGRYSQLGVGWYTAIEPNIAWFFGTLAAEALDACTIIEMEIAEATLRDLLDNGQAKREVIGNVPFEGEQI